MSIDNMETDNHKKIIIDFYNSFDALAHLVSNSEDADYFMPENIVTAIKVVRAFISIINEGLYQSLDSATVHNFHIIFKYWIKQIQYCDEENAKELRFLLRDFSFLMYDIDHNIVREKEKTM